jgi:predicted transglutaminase-like cysteine proteinase
MRVGWFVAALIAGVCFAPSEQATAGMIGTPMQLRALFQRIQFETPTLPPMKYSEFCLRYADECAVKPVRFRGGAVKMNDERWVQLLTVNADVNEAIVPQRNYGGLATETWLIAPDRGDCNDYAVTKRHQLIRMGWPARALLLSEVVTTRGEHHLVVVVRTSDGDLVLDNLATKIRRWNQTPYRWLRIQSPSQPKLWSTIAPRGSRPSVAAS